MELMKRRNAGGRRAPRLAAAIAAAALLLSTFWGASAATLVGATHAGETPTRGGSRPGPLGFTPAVSATLGARPRAIQIGAIGVDAQVETVHFVDGVMQNPTGPWIVSWYQETAKLGSVGNIVLAGHLDYWDVGRAVFYDVGHLQKGDRISVRGSDKQTYAYEVDWTKLYDVVNAPIQEIVGPTPTESLTLITCGGPFDSQNGVYLQRTVVRAHRVAV